MLIWFEVFGSKIKKRQRQIISVILISFAFDRNDPDANRCIVIEPIRTKDRVFSYHGSIVQKSAARAHLSVFRAFELSREIVKKSFKELPSVIAKPPPLWHFVWHPFIVKCVKDVYTCFMYLSSKSTRKFATHCLWIKEAISNYA